MKPSDIKNINIGKLYGMEKYKANNKRQVNKIIKNFLRRNHNCCDIGLGLFEDLRFEYPISYPVILVIDCAVSNDGYDAQVVMDFVSLNDFE